MKTPANAAWPLLTPLVPCTLLALIGACATSAPSTPAAPVPAAGTRASEAGLHPQPSAAGGPGAALVVSALEEPGPLEAASRREDSSAGAPAGSPPEQAGRQRLGSGAVELQIWNDPDFRRRFAESYQAETEVEPRVTVEVRERMQEILELISDEQLDKAAGLLKKHGGPSANAVFDFTAGNIHFQREEYERAAEAYRNAVQKFPRFRRAWRWLGMCYVRLDDLAQARQAFTQVVELGGGDAQVYGVLGFAYLNGNDPIAAESAYRMALLLDPDTLDFKLGLARSFLMQRRYADVVALCDTLIEHSPERAEFWLLQANAYIGLREPLRAAENYELVDSLGQATAGSRLNLADIYVNEQLFDLAADAYLAALEAAPDGGGVDATRLLRAARVMNAQGGRAETRRLLDGVEATLGERLELEQKKELLKLRSRLALAEGAGEEEARVLEEIVTLDPLDGDALILLGQHAQRAGELERASAYFERAANLEDFEADAKLAQGQLLASQGQYAEALPLLRRAQALKPRESVQAYLEQVEQRTQTRAR